MKISRISADTDTRKKREYRPIISADRYIGRSLVHMYTWPKLIYGVDVRAHKTTHLHVALVWSEPNLSVPRFCVKTQKHDTFNR